MKKLIRKLIGGSNKQGISFLLCVLLAAFIWVINALNETHSSSVVIPIVYDKEISKNSTHPLPPSIQVEVKGRGFSLWGFNREARKYTIHTPYLTSRTKDTIISTKDAIFGLMHNYSKDISVVDIKPSQLIFSGVEFYSKKLAVKGAFELNFQTPYIQSGPSIYYPDSIWVYSNEKIPTEISDIIAETVIVKNVSHQVFKKVKLKKPFPNYRLLQNNAWLLVPVEEGTEISLEVPIQTQYGETFIPSSVTVTCLVPMSKYPLTHPKKFRVSHLKDVGDHEKAFVQVTHAPYWANRIMYTPQLVHKLTKSFE
ncbi:MAG: hypothetical protein IPK10_01370 [Bacteroidetes bacterium]|nr:hypothetical protein [Bacteroidota bacterium]